MNHNSPYTELADRLEASVKEHRGAFVSATEGTLICLALRVMVEFQQAGVLRALRHISSNRRLDDNIFQFHWAIENRVKNLDRKKATLAKRQNPEI